MNPDILEDIFAASNIRNSHSNLLLNSHNSLLTRQEDNAEHEPVPSPPRILSRESRTAISKIESVFESIATCILEDRKELTIHLKGRKASRTKENDTSAEDLNRDLDQGRAITFPGKTPQEAWKFTVLLRILELSHEALVNGTRITKRDIYYSDPELFVKQGVVDRYVDDLAHTFSINRSELHVVAAAKGLTAGSLCFLRKDSTTVDCSLENDGMLVPDPDFISSYDLSQTNWILVIEKEATFRSLVASRYWERSKAGKGLLITAKGYPDIQSRSFLHKISCSTTCPPIHCLVDFDPDGINILSTYKHGSANLAHETNLVIPRISWLGVKSSDIMFYQNQGQGLISLTPRDRRMAIKTLQRDSLEEEWRRELQVMLMLGAKAEIQIINSADGAGLGIWLDKKLQGD